MNTAKLYRWFLSGIGIVLGAGAILWFAQGHLLAKNNPEESAPAFSGLNEVEFESGKLAHALREKQRTRLHSYHGNPKTDAFVEVPVDRAIQEYLSRKGESP